MLWGVHTGEALACEGCGATSGRGRGSTFQGIISDLPGVAAQLCAFIATLFDRAWFRLASAAAGISGAVIAEWPRTAGCGQGSYAWVSATGWGDSAATPLSAGSAKETRLVLRGAISGLYTYQKAGGGRNPMWVTFFCF